MNDGCSPRPRPWHEQSPGTGRLCGRLGFIVLGGLVAAVTGPLHFDRGSWLAAYLVLVCGVAQCAIGRQRLVLEPHSSQWHGSGCCSTAGTSATPWWSPVAGFHSGRHRCRRLAAGGRAGPRCRRNPAARRPAAAVLVRAFYLVLLVSGPVGLVLAHLRAGSS